MTTNVPTNIPEPTSEACPEVTLAETDAAARPYQHVASDLGVDRATVQAREEERFGGIKFGSAFFGWLTAAGIAAILMSLLAATGVALSLANNTTTAEINQQATAATGTARTVGLIGGIALLITG